ncbi:MAG: DEAD/DEAH box helicase [Anaerolineae bacterium]
MYLPHSENQPMDVFSLRSQLISDYAAYIESFIKIRDEHIRQYVEAALDGGAFWPDPLIQLNPSFEPGEWIDDLADQGVLHPTAKQVFRLEKPTNLTGKRMRLHRHQADAVRAARSGENYVLTTGTGSGKSLSYIVPIVDHVLRRGSGKGIQAVIIYPMNALANSQLGELDKFLGYGFDGKPPVTYERYTGQEKDEKRNEIIKNPPDILLTNYVMLELMMTRPRERKLIEAMRGLQFLVLDELHTYRGRQGADVAMLVRRVREVCQTEQLQCVGTSATLAEGGTFAEQQVKIAEVAGQIFGAEVKPERVIGETLRRATEYRALDDPDFVAHLRQRLGDPNQLPPNTHQEFVTDPLSIWIETTFGLAVEEGTNRLKRATPLSISGDDGAARQLASLTGFGESACTAAIQAGLLAGYNVSDPETGFPVFAFRLHQFISRGDAVYASLETPSQRHITLNGQKFVPGRRDKILLPVCFCRECGQEYYIVNRVTDPDSDQISYQIRQLRDQSRDDDLERGFLYHSDSNPWPESIEQQLEENLLPEDWLEPYKDGLRVKYSQRHKLPKNVRVSPLGEETAAGAPYTFVRSPFAFCLNCGVTYSGREFSDFGKLAILSSEGRSTATTVLSLSAIRALRRDEALKQKAKKLLSFTDNRQDASLQAGHFNDFIEVGLVRSALYRAVDAAGDNGIAHDKLALKVFEALNLPFELYARSAEDTGRPRIRRVGEAFRNVLGYRIYQDLRRGWRITAPNLEQCGLLQIDYPDLPALCADETAWANCHPTLTTATSSERLNVCKVFLDLLRRGLAIRVDYLDTVYQEQMKLQSSQQLAVPWAIDETERMTHNFVAVPGPRRVRSTGEYLFVSPRSGFGTFLRRAGTFPQYDDHKLTLDDTQTIIEQLFAVLAREGLLDQVEDPQSADDQPGYQLLADAMLWHAGDGDRPFYDPIRMPSLPDPTDAAARTNAFFVSYYQSIAAELTGVEAREHTAQVPSDEREAREEEFRKAKLPILYCSPTMELGVDISQLNAVNMRNVPPTPANYAQRSGRAGRSGQPALVFTYCTTGSPHDQYFFKRPALMVAGSVRPPRLDLANEDLIRAHVHAVWLAETRQDLHDSLKDLLELEGDIPTLAVRASVLENLGSAAARQRAEQRLVKILGTIAETLAEAGWYDDTWLANTLKQATSQFDEKCNRWRDLYLSALKQRDRQDEIVRSPASSPKDKEAARRLRAEAESQLSLLLDTRSAAFSDFYSYRYFASEGFLPGYNFPRLPLSAYIPGRRGRRQPAQDEFLSRPRFLAISEFGPRSIIYHEGSRYVINKAILPVSDNGLLTSKAKVCDSCGYLHPIPDHADGADLCDNCGTLLPNAYSTLFRMQNVATHRRDRINSDEEERVRMGYELQTSVRFAEHGGRPIFTVATVTAADGRLLLKLTYGSAATLWRINKGWRRRRDPELLGFVLDVERGYWQRNEQEPEPDSDDPLGPLTQRVIPFVEDTRNCLLLEFADQYDTPVMASLQPALKSAIQVLYQVEDNELAAEPLPSVDDRRVILLYESAEGGAGVLRQLVADPQAILRVAREALALCHFDPDTREDKRRAPGAKEDCEAACYDCLMSYYNQPDHEHLDRKLVLGPLFELSQGVVSLSPSTTERADHLQRLKADCDSDLEIEWLDFLDARQLALPDLAQKYIAACETRCDFYYSGRGVAIYVDGPHHDQPDIARQDAAITDCLEADLGLTVLRFRYDQKEQWAGICADHAYLFGQGRDSQ